MEHYTKLQLAPRNLSRQPAILRRKLIIVLVLLIGLKLADNRLRDRIWSAVLTYYWQTRCLAHERPSDQIAYIAAPAGVTVPSSMRIFVSPSQAIWTGTIAAVPYPIELAELQRRTSPNATNVPWEQLPSPVFLHGLRDSQGRERLVTVYALANNPRGWWSLVAVARREMSGLHHPFSPRHVSSAACWPMPNTSSDTVIVYTGQPDSQARSQFTIRIVINGKSQTVTGRMRDDGSIDFTSSSGLSPWSTHKAGAIELPVIVQPTTQPTTAPSAMASPFDCESILLPCD